MDGVAVKPAYIAGVDTFYRPADGAVKFLEIGEIPVFFGKFYVFHRLQHVHSLVHAVQCLEENGLDGVPEVPQGSLDLFFAADGKGVAGKQDFRAVGHNGGERIDPGGDVSVLAATNGVEVGPAGVVIVSAAEDLFLGKPDKELIVGLAHGGNQF